MITEEVINEIVKISKSEELKLYKRGKEHEKAKAIADLCEIVSNQKLAQWSKSVRELHESIVQLKKEEIAIKGRMNEQAKEHKDGLQKALSQHNAELLGIRKKAKEDSKIVKAEGERLQADHQSLMASLDATHSARMEARERETEEHEAARGRVIRTTERCLQIAIESLSELKTAASS